MAEVFLHLSIKGWHYAEMTIGLIPRLPPSISVGWHDSIFALVGSEHHCPISTCENLRLVLHTEATLRPQEANAFPWGGTEWEEKTEKQVYKQKYEIETYLPKKDSDSCWLSLPRATELSFAKGSINAQITPPVVVSLWEQRACPEVMKVGIANTCKGT